LSRLSPDGGIGGRAFISLTREGMMAGKMPKELFESLASLGDMVTRLVAARDAAICANREYMTNWLAQAEREFNAFKKDCDVICIEMEGQQ
jgi:2-hydroxy-3-keto-5-methylthiopentenyl-1-phosphate phosphatase